MSGRVAIKEICCAKIISILKVTAIEKRGEILGTCSKMGQIKVIIIRVVDGEDGLQERRLIKGLSKEIFRLSFIAGGGGGKETERERIRRGSP